MRNPFLVYVLLALYGLLTLILVSYVRSKFQAAAKALNKLHNDWQGAQSNHANFIDVAQGEAFEVERSGHSCSRLCAEIRWNRLLRCVTRSYRWRNGE